MNVEMKPPEKKKRKKTTAKKNASPPPPTPPSFSLLPDDITVNCLARIPRSYYPKLSIVSKTFKSLLSSPELYATRSHLGNTEQCLYVCIRDSSRQSHQWYTLWINPNRTKKKRKKTIGHFLVPIPSSDFASMAKHVVVCSDSASMAKPIVVGSEIYVIGDSFAPSYAVRVLDCRSHTWRDAPSMNVARENALSCLYDGKIYVIGGVNVDESPFAEVFNTKTQTWECIPDPDTDIRKCYINIIAEMDGKIIFGSACKMYAYDTKKGEWECCGNIVATYARSSCVIENESYYFGYEFSADYSFVWTDINGGCYKQFKGLDPLVNMYWKNGGPTSNTTRRAFCGGKLYIMWQGYKRRNRDHKDKILCAEISLEKRDGGDIWGNVEWVDVLHTVPRSCKLVHLLAASV